MEPKTVRTREEIRDAIRGCLVGGAIGDALGYPVEFMEESEIFPTLGPKGITAYALDPVTRKALISDDTQMTLFTAAGLLARETRGVLNGAVDKPREYIAKSYLDWLRTQEMGQYGQPDPEEITAVSREDTVSWLAEVPELYNWRAPGRACLKSCRYLKQGRAHPDSLYSTVWNDKKGCGGIMRIAPVALGYHADIKDVDREAAEAAAITHGHPLGYMTAAVAAHIIHESVYGDPERPLKELVLEARDTVAEIYEGTAYVEDLVRVIDEAVACSENGDSDLENIHRLGAGWVAEETLAISLYCSLKYQDFFSKAVITAVNHDGDSDSTGAVTGNILGARLGFDNIHDRWKKDLELYDVILQIADDLAAGPPADPEADPEWKRKYIR